MFPACLFACRRKIFCHKEYIAWCIAEHRFISMVFSFPGFELDYVVLDWMHIADLGVSLYMLGNSMWYLFKNKMHGKHTNLVSSNDTCVGIVVFLKMATKNLQSNKKAEPPINKLTLAMFRPTMEDAPQTQGQGGRVQGSHALRPVDVREYVPTDLSI